MRAEPALLPWLLQEYVSYCLYHIKYTVLFLYCFWGLFHLDVQNRKTSPWSYWERYIDVCVAAFISLQWHGIKLGIHFLLLPINATFLLDPLCVWIIGEFLYLLCKPKSLLTCFFVFALVTIYYFYFRWKGLIFSYYFSIFKLLKDDYSFLRNLVCLEQL